MLPLGIRNTNCKNQRTGPKEISSIPTKNPNRTHYQHVKLKAIFDYKQYPDQPSPLRLDKGI
jgi:hypothetical protein